MWHDVVVRTQTTRDREPTAAETITIDGAIEQAIERGTLGGVLGSLFGVTVLALAVVIAVLITWVVWSKRKRERYQDIPMAR